MVCTVSTRIAESEVLDGIRVGLLRILGVGVGVEIFDPTLTPKVQFNYFSTCFPVYFYLLHKQAVHGLFDHETLGRCCQCF